MRIISLLVIMFAMTILQSCAGTRIEGRPAVEFGEGKEKIRIEVGFVIEKIESPPPKAGKTVIKNEVNINPQGKSIIEASKQLNAKYGKSIEISVDSKNSDLLSMSGKSYDVSKPDQLNALVKKMREAYGLAGK